MQLLGGLHPIRSRIFLDTATLLALGYVVFSGQGGPASNSGTCKNVDFLPPNEDNGIRVVDDESELLVPPVAAAVASGISIVTTATSSLLILLLVCVVTLVTAGTTKRWTISFPLVPFVLLQLIYFKFFFDEQPICPNNSASDEQTSLWTWTLSWLAPSSLIQVLSVSLIAFSAVLCILFPAVKISTPKGEYNVGIVDVHLPVKFLEDEAKMHELDMMKASSTACPERSSVDTVPLRNTTVSQKQMRDVDNDSCSFNEAVPNGYVSARLLYPTLDSNKNDSIPYFDPYSAKKICTNLMKVGAPPPLNKLSWMLDTWQLSSIAAKRNAKPLKYICSKKGQDNKSENDEQNRTKMPLVIFSHGITGNAAIYSYQCMNLASNGNLVLMIDHSDGSAIGMRKHDGSFLNFDPSIGALLEVCGTKYVRARRRQTDFRVSEFIAASLGLIRLNEINIPDLEELGISFVNKLNVHNIAAGGHSFGAATAVAAASRRPDIFSCVIAHDPALDWMPDDARKTLFDESRFQGSDLNYSGGTGGYEEADYNHEEKKEVVCSGKTEKSLHDLDFLFLYSHQWKKFGWGGYSFIFDMFRRGRLGPKKDNVSICSFVYGSHHSEFSDSCMKTPLWLARATGFTGKRNPHETAEEIASNTIEFLENVSKKQKDLKKKKKTEN